MPTDFERDLSALLHTVTPEPPDHLAPPRIAELSDRSAGAVVIELARGAEHPPRHHRWPAILAAASIAALIAGVLGALHLAGTGHRAASVRPPTTSAASVPRCSSDNLVISDDPFTTRGSTGTGGFTYTNTGTARCTVALTAVTISAEPASRTPFPGSAQTIQIPGHGKVVFTVHVRVIGQCRTAKQGVRLNVTEGSWTYSTGLHVTGCALTPLRLTDRVTRP